MLEVKKIVSWPIPQLDKYPGGFCRKTKLTTQSQNVQMEIRLPTKSTDWEGALSIRYDTTEEFNLDSKAEYTA